MDELDRLLAQRACEELIYEYARRVDMGDAARIADLFTKDARWQGDIVLDGQDQIREWFTRRGEVTRRVSRHVCTNVTVNVHSETEADSVCYMINYRHDRAEGDLSLPVPADAPKYVGELHDQFRRTSEGWRFSGRLVVVTFVRQRTHRAGA